MTHGRAGRFVSELRQHNYEQSVKALQKSLGHARLDDPEEVPKVKTRQPEVWLKSWDGSHMRLDWDAVDEHQVDLAELTIMVTLLDGRAYVGSIEVQHPGSIIIRLWGGRATRIGFRSIRRMNLLDRHTHAEERLVRCRQACGEPAATFSEAGSGAASNKPTAFGKPRPNELSNPPTT